MRKLIPAFLLFQLLSLLPGQELRPSSDSKYRVGEVWEYRTRPGEDKSTFTVLKVEATQKLGTIVHISVDGLHWTTCAKGNKEERVGHMPFAIKSIEASATPRVSTSTKFPDQGGYEQWRQAFVKGKAGVYTIPIKDAVAVVEESLRANNGCGSVR